MESEPSQDRVAVVVNGNAKRVTSELVVMLDQIVRSGDLFVSRSLDEGKQIAKQIVDRGYGTVLTGGGDGTFTQVVSWVVAECEKQGKVAPRFGFLMLGTGNALAWSLGAKRGAVADLARLRQEGGSREIRLLDVEGVLSPFAGFGGDAIALNDYNDVKQAMQRIPVLRRFAAGGVAYAIGIGGFSLPKVFVRAPLRVRITNISGVAERLGVDGQPVGRPIGEGEVLYEGTARGVLMSTIPYWGFGARIFPFADDRADRFNLRIVDVSSLDLAINLKSIWRGTYRDDRLHDFLVQDIKLQFEEPQAFQIGGDAYGTRTSTTVRLSRTPIRVVDYYAPPPT